MRFLLTIILSLSLIPAFSLEGPFRSISFEEALKAAEKEKKLVFVDFYTTWCGPCKMMDRNTFTDEAVVRWLTDNAIPLKIDAEKMVPLATRYRVDAYPMMLLINPDGSEKGRIVGYRPPDEFLTEVANLQSGLDPIAEFEKKVQGPSAKDPQVRMDFGDLLAQSGKYDKALEQYLWCYDFGVKNNPSFAGARGSFLLDRIQNLARAYPQANLALRQRRDGFINEINNSEKLNELVLTDAIRLNEILGDSATNLQLYEAIKSRTLDDAVWQYVIGVMYPTLLDAGRYHDLSIHLDKLTEKLFSQWDMVKDRLGNNPDGAPEIKLWTIGQLAGHYRVWSAIGNNQKAQSLAERMIAIDAGPDTYNELAWNGFLSGQVQPVHLEQARTAFNLSGGKNAPVIDTLARILAVMDQKPEGIALVSKALPEFYQPHERTILQECLADLQKN